MKKTNRKGLIKSLLTTLCAALLLLGVGTHRIYADEEIPAEPNIEGLTAEEANALIDEYNEKVDEYNEKMEAQFEAEVEKVEAHNAAEDEKVAENQKELEAYNNAQAKIEKHEEKGITTNRTDNYEELPEDYTVTVEAEDAKTIKVIEEAEVKSGKTVKVMNIHLFFDEDCSSSGTINDLSNLKTDEDVIDHLALAEWETIEVDENDVIEVVSEAESMGYRSASFYKWIEGYTNGFWMPSYSLFTSTAVDSYSTWDKGAAQIASYGSGTTDRRAAVDMFSLYAYTFYRTGAEPTYEEYTPDYRETPQAPEQLKKMDHIEAQEIIEVNEEPAAEPGKKEPIVTPTIENNEPETKEPAVIEEIVEEVADEEVPMSISEEVTMNVSEEIFDEAVPMAAPAAEAHWALLNLIAAIATALISLLTILGIFRKNEEEKEEEENRNDQYESDKYLSLIPAALAIIIFILTEDMRLAMILADRWTLLMAIILIANIALAFLIHDQKTDEGKKEEVPALVGSRAIL
ncbi:MAG: hypothetical protein IJU42_00220 [Erysipelotrichaceae bacterium]|nr:hypothetical protein [Erysipelotrichaceae bacterium]